MRNRKCKLEKQYTNAQLAKAVQEAKDNIACNKPAGYSALARLHLGDAKYANSIRYHVKGDKTHPPPPVGKKQGRATLSEAAERQLILLVKQHEDLGLSLWPETLCEYAKELATAEGTCFKTVDATPGKDWVASFLKRHDLKRKKPLPLSSKRAAAQTPETVNNFFVQYEKVLDLPCDTRDPSNVKTFRDLVLTRVGNADEVGIQRCLSQTGQVIVGKASKVCYTPGTGNRTSVTDFACGTVGGYKFPSVFIKKGKPTAKQVDAKKKVLLSASEPGTHLFFNEDSHFINKELFPKILHALADMVPGGVSPAYKFLLVLDGHNSRLSVKAVETARTLGFELFILPANMTQLLQPWDQCFSCIKREYRELYKAYTTKNGHKSLVEPVWLGMITTAYRNACAKNNNNLLRSGWEHAGLWPVDREKILARTFTSDRDHSTNAPEMAGLDVLASVASSRAGDDGLARVIETRLTLQARIQQVAQLENKAAAAKKQDKRKRENAELITSDTGLQQLKEVEHQRTVKTRRGSRNAAGIDAEELRAVLADVREIMAQGTGAGRRRKNAPPAPSGSDTVTE